MRSWPTPRLAGIASTGSKLIHAQSARALESGSRRMVQRHHAAARTQWAADRHATQHAADLAAVNP